MSVSICYDHFFSFTMVLVTFGFRLAQNQTKNLLILTKIRVKLVLQGM